MIKRGELRFKWTSVTTCSMSNAVIKMNVEVWLGEPHGEESERVLECDASFVPDLISGLSAMLRQKDRG